eukprot:3368898-Prymnesium_polylepis.1
MTLEDRMLVRMPHQDWEGQAEAARGLVLVHTMFAPDWDSARAVTGVRRQVTLRGTKSDIFMVAADAP